MGRPAKKRPRVVRILLWTLGVVAVCAGAGLLVAHRLSQVDVIPVSEDQLRMIAGNDLVWQPERPSKPTFDVAILQTPAILHHPYVGRSQADVVKHARDIESTRQVTDEVEREIRGKVPAPAAVSKAGGSVIGVGAPVVRLYANQVRLCLVRKDMAGAVDRIQKAAEMVEVSKGYRSGVVIPGATFNSIIRSTLETHLLSAAQLRAVYAAYPAAPPTDKDLCESLNYEYQCMALLVRTVTNQSIATEAASPASGPTVDLLSTGPDEPPVGQFDGPETMRELASLWREAKRNCLLPWSKQSWPVADAYSASIKRIPEQPHIDANASGLARWWAKTQYRWSAGHVRNVLGLAILYNLIAEDGPRIFINESFRYRTQCEATRLLIAIEIYEKTFSKYPASLADLKALNLPNPDYVDFFSGGPFRYDAGRRTLWSVGPNARDDGGHLVRGGSQDDIAFAVP